MNPRMGSGHLLYRDIGVKNSVQQKGVAVQHKPITAGNWL